MMRSNKDMMPPRTILAAVDFSDTSRVALALAARLARHCVAELHVLHVEEPLLAAAAAHTGIDLARETREELGRFIADAWPAAESSPHLHVVAGAAVGVILDVAHQQRADLVVVGSHGMSGAAKLVFGSTTEGVLRRADVSVLVSPAGWTPPRPDAADLGGAGPMVAGLDPADAAAVAVLNAACALAAVLGTFVEAVHVVPNLAVPSRWRAYADVAARDRIAGARQDVERVIRNARCSVRMEMRVESGTVPNQLVEAAGAARGRSPILVLGKKTADSRGGAPGTIAYRVLSLANVPVLMHVAGPEA